MISQGATNEGSQVKGNPSRLFGHNGSPVKRPGVRAEDTEAGAVLH